MDSYRGHAEGFVRTLKSGETVFVYSDHSTGEQEVLTSNNAPNYFNGNDTVHQMHPKSCCHQDKGFVSTGTQTHGVTISEASSKSVESSINNGLKKFSQRSTSTESDVNEQTDHDDMYECDVGMETAGVCNDVEQDAVFVKRYNSTGTETDLNAVGDRQTLESLLRWALSICCSDSTYNLTPIQGMADLRENSDQSIFTSATEEFQESITCRSLGKNDTDTGIESQSAFSSASGRETEPIYSMDSTYPAPIQSVVDVTANPDNCYSLTSVIQEFQDERMASRSEGQIHTRGVEPQTVLRTGSYTGTKSTWKRRAKTASSVQLCEQTQQPMRETLYAPLKTNITVVQSGKHAGSDKSIDTRQRRHAKAASNVQLHEQIQQPISKNTFVHGGSSIKIIDTQRCAKAVSSVQLGEQTQHLSDNDSVACSYADVAMVNPVATESIVMEASQQPVHVLAISDHMDVEYPQVRKSPSDCHTVSSGHKQQEDQSINSRYETTGGENTVEISGEESMSSYASIQTMNVLPSTASAGSVLSMPSMKQSIRSDQLVTLRQGTCHSHVTSTTSTATSEEQIPSSEAYLRATENHQEEPKLPLIVPEQELPDPDHIQPSKNLSRSSYKRRKEYKRSSLAYEQDRPDPDLIQPSKNLSRSSNKHRKERSSLASSNYVQPSGNISRIPENHREESEHASSAPEHNPQNPEEQSQLPDRQLQTPEKHWQTKRQKRFDCVNCEKTFPTKCELRRHMPIHTRERPFQCSVCGKTFARKDYFKFHARLHSGDKRYVCHECAERFMYKHKLRVHLVNAHGYTYSEIFPMSAGTAGKHH